MCIMRRPRRLGSVERRVDEVCATYDPGSLILINKTVVLIERRGELLRKHAYLGLEQIQTTAEIGIRHRSRTMPLIAMRVMANFCFVSENKIILTLMVVSNPKHLNFRT